MSLGFDNSTCIGTALYQENVQIEQNGFVDEEPSKHKDILPDSEEETMQEKRNRKLEKRARQHIRTQVICPRFVNICV